MRFKGDATLKRLPDEDDGDNRNTKILGYSLRGKPNDELNLMMPMIVLLNAMLMNGYQRLN